VGHEGVRGGPELAFGAAFVEQAPLRAARIERVQNDVAMGLMEVLDERRRSDRRQRSAGPWLGFRDHVRHGDGLAHTGRANEHRVALFEPPGIG
jgi:hypothetical protein